MTTRKRWTKQEDETPELIISREKRKWQINLRRYVLEKSTCPSYAPFFGLDIERLRQWFESQFTDGLSWTNFGERWHFDHILPVTYFDFFDEEDLKLCWSFINLRIAPIEKKSKGLDLSAARKYFQELYDKTQYGLCDLLLNKLDEIEVSGFLSTKVQQNFIREHQEYLNQIEEYSIFEFELLNSGRSIEEVAREVELFKKSGI